MIAYLASLNWTDLMKHKTAKKCWIIFKDEIEGIIKTFVPIKIKGNYLGRNTCQKKLYERLPITK